ncbi:hypothetical protein D3C85_1183160 [compost metagenome]
MAQHHRHLRGLDLQFLGHDLRQRGPDARAEVDVAVEGKNLAVGADGDKDIRQIGYEIGGGTRLSRRWPRRGRSGPRDQQHASFLEQCLTQCARSPRSLMHRSFVLAAPGGIHGRRNGRAQGTTRLYLQPRHFASALLVSPDYGKHAKRHRPRACPTGHLCPPGPGYARQDPQGRHQGLRPERLRRRTHRDHLVAGQYL